MGTQAWQWQTGRIIGTPARYGVCFQMRYYRSLVLSSFSNYKLFKRFWLNVNCSTILKILWLVFQVLKWLAIKLKKCCEFGLGRDLLQHCVPIAVSVARCYGNLSAQNQWPNSPRGAWQQLGQYVGRLKTNLQGREVESPRQIYCIGKNANQHFSRLSNVMERNHSVERGLLVLYLS